jgi:hypothetical protein
MTKIRVLILLITILVVGSIGVLGTLYARGYRFDIKNKEIVPKGLLVIKSDPDAAQIFINGELKTVTNATISLEPGEYDVQVKKEGYLSWNKRLTIEKEIVTEATANLFRTAPSLSPMTFTPTYNPVVSPSITKIAYAIIPSDNVDSSTQVPQDKIGLWVMETVSLPLGFAREPRKVTDGILSNANWKWSPDERQILLTTPTGSYLIDANEYTPQNQSVNINYRIDQILETWEEELNTKLELKINRLPDDLSSILNRKTSSIAFSPDGDMVLYTASGSATIPDNLIKQLPGSSTQKQEREIKDGKTYIYDVKEDRNFLITDFKVSIAPDNLNEKALLWFPTSRHVILSEENKISIVDYDGTNKQEVYSGSYASPHAFPTASSQRLIILTNLGAESAPLNLYSLSIK